MQTLTDWVGNFAVDLPSVLEQKIPVLVYYGTNNFACNYLGGKRWANAMVWPGQSAFQLAPEVVYMVDATVVGLSKAAQGLTFLQIFNAGHMVPMDQPSVSLNMFKRFASGTV